MLDHLLRPGQDEHRAVADLGVGASALVFAALPHADHAGVGHLAEVALGERLADERCAHDHSLRDEQLVEVSDHVRHGVVGNGASREELAKQFAQPYDVGAAGQLEDVHRSLGLGQRDDAHAVVDQFAHGEGDVGVGLVLAGGHHHGALLNPDVAVKIRVVEFADGHRVALVMQA